MKNLVGILVLILLWSSIASAKSLIVVDGDTIILNGEKIRFSGIDTPELKQTCKKNDEIVYCGIEAKKLLIDKIGNSKVNCINEGEDRYKRILAECFVNDLSLSSYLVKKGYAFAYRKYSKKFIKDEDYAKANNLGMWSMNFEFPWDYRRKN